MEQIDQREKTLVFCATQQHAALVRDLINQMKKSSGPNYCVRVTADDGALGEQWLRTFQEIISRGTRLFDGKDYFTIYDFVKAYEHFWRTATGPMPVMISRSGRCP
jgi:type I restriction enzyme R subunit